MKIARSTAVAALLLTAPTVLGAGAAERLDVKLGLWEMTSIMRFSGIPPLPKELLDKLTPEQRAEMIADLTAAAAEEPEEDVSSECITEEDLDKPFKSADDDCTQTVVRTTRNTQEIRMTCSGKIKGSGLFRITTPTRESMTGELDLKTGEGPDAFTLKGTIKGRWLGPDCGDEDDDEDMDENDEDDEIPEE